MRVRLIGVLLAASALLIADPASAGVLPVPVGASGVDAPADPAPEPVPAACGWLVVGHWSNCDNLDPNQLYTDPSWPTACTTNNDLLTRTVKSATLPDGSLLQLTYAGATCRTVAASLYVPNYSGSQSCTVTITRSSDQARSSARVARSGGFWSAETLSLYDAGVAIVASASCSYGGHTYAGETAGW